MIFSAESGYLNIKVIDIAAVSLGSIVLIGDCKTVQLGFRYEEPPETMIVGISPAVRTVREP